MLQWIGLGVAGELGAHLAHPVAQADHPVEALVGEHVQVLRRVAGRGRCRAPLASPARRWGAAAWDGCRRCTPRRPRPIGPRPAPRPSGSGRCCRCTGTAPVPRSVGRPARRGGASETKAGVERAAGGRQQAADAGADRRCSRRRGRSAELRRAETSRPSRSLPRWYETRFCGSPTRPVSSCTVRSLRASSPSSRQRSGCPASCRNADAPRSPRTGRPSTRGNIHQ